MQGDSCQPLKSIIQDCIGTDCRYFNAETQTCDYIAIVQGEREERAKRDAQKAKKQALKRQTIGQRA